MRYPVRRLVRVHGHPADWILYAVLRRCSVDMRSLFARLMSLA
jgi:hypothetical protein